MLFSRYRSRDIIPSVASNMVVVELMVALQRAELGFLEMRLNSFGLIPHVLANESQFEQIVV